MADRPNIIYIFTDQQCAGSMSCAGNPYLETPAMDSIAETGCRFENAYCAFPLCTPSRAAMFTGRWPHEIGITDNGQAIPPGYRQQELGVLLTNAGYDCAYGGKWHIPELEIPEEHGFENICGFDDMSLPKACAAFLKENRSNPFFLVAAFDNPHNICEWRRQQVLPWGDIGDPPAIENCPPLPGNFHPTPFGPEAVDIMRLENPRLYPPPSYSCEQWRRYRWAYYRLIERVDWQIAMILHILTETGLDQHTVVIFSSDHGDSNGAHQLAQKSVLYNEATRVPFIIREPSADAGVVDTQHLVNNGPDLYATILDYAGLEKPPGSHGRSVRAILEADRKRVYSWPDHVVTETVIGKHNCKGRMVRSERYKYVCYEFGAYREQLYDMERDPGEMVNLALCAKHRDVLEEHRDLLRDWCIKTNDTFCGGHYAHRDTPFILPGDHYNQSV